MKNFDALKQHGDIIWNIANLLRGPYPPPQYRRVMIPLTVLRRLDCVLEASKDKVIAHHNKLKADGKHDDDVIEKVINQKFGLTFHNTSEFTFQKLLGDPDKLAANQADQLFFDQIQEEAVESEALRRAAESNSKDDFRYVFEKAFEGLVIDRMEGNEEIFGRLMRDGDFRHLAVSYLLDKVYGELKNTKGADLL